MTGRTTPEFSSSSPTSQMDYYEEGSTPTMKNKMRASHLYNTPRGRRFTERVAEAVEVPLLGRPLEDNMALDSPSPVRIEDVDMLDSSPLQLRNNKTIRKRRSLAKFGDMQRQRRKLRHTAQRQQAAATGGGGARDASDDDYVDDDYEEVESDDEYLHRVSTSKKLESRQSSVGSEEGQSTTNNNNGASSSSPPPPTTTTPTRSLTGGGAGRRRRLRLQNSNIIPLDAPDIDEDASPTFFPNKSRSINPAVVQPIVLGTTNGVSKEARRRRPNSFAEKVDRFRHAPDVDMLDLSKHLIIPDNTNHTSSTPSSSTSTAGSAHHYNHQQQQQQNDDDDDNEEEQTQREQQDQDDREESPIAIPDHDAVDMEHTRHVVIKQEHTGVSTTAHTGDDFIDDDDDDSASDGSEQPLDIPCSPQPKDQPHDTSIESPSSPITPQPMTTMPENNNITASTITSKDLAQNNDTIMINTQQQQRQQSADNASTTCAGETTLVQLNMTAEPANEQQEVHMEIVEEAGENHDSHFWAENSGNKIVKQEPKDDDDNNNTYHHEEEGGESLHARQNSYLGRVVGSVSRFLWGS
ncbi:hypothetical protein BDB00DRAFT_853215 [Zychaea mexicana]|uniref:uncharacterized protein n=1 Tax=Zychaea mexicana TaxID=64656 RepID=UPI0022FDB5D6|nr:uncharacterized protein BDB00DRAFT_853215 [Zychaea mexicana]KAI9484843.1 hypothetical protein BDB00DRAFT_853215 [Zychaea mexicana]